jgi:hypothetical protein
VRGSVVIPENKTTVGSLALLVEFVQAEFSDGISPSADQIVFVLEPSQPPKAPAVEPGIGVTLPGGCLVPHRRGGWTLGDGSVKTCGFEFYHLWPDRTRVDLTALVSDVDARLVQTVATKGWQMKLQVDFTGLDATGIVGPTMIAAAVGNDVGMTYVTSSRESLGIGSASQFPGMPSLTFARLQLKYREQEKEGSLGQSVQFDYVYEPGEDSNGLAPELEDLTVLVEPPASAPTEPSLVTWLPAGCLVPHKIDGWTLVDASGHTCGFRYLQLFPDKTVDLTPFVEDLSVRLTQAITDKSWRLKVGIEVSGQQSAGIVSPSMIGARLGDDGGIIMVASKIDFFGTSGHQQMGLF